PEASPWVCEALASSRDELTAADENSGQQVRVTSEVLRRTMHDRRGSQLQGPAQNRCRERVVDQDRHSAGAGQAAHRLKVMYAAEGVGDRLTVKQRRPA